MEGEMNMLVLGEDLQKIVGGTKLIPINGNVAQAHDGSMLMILLCYFCVIYMLMESMSFSHCLHTHKDTKFSPLYFGTNILEKLEAYQ